MLPAVVDEVQAMIDALAPGSARAITAGLAALDQLTRLTRVARGRPFRRLGVAEARAVLASALEGRAGPVPMALVVPLRTLVVSAYYDHPEVRRSLGYTPESWIGEVTARRLRLHAEDLG